MSLLAIDGLNVAYGAIQAVNNLSIEVNEGEIVALLGANGAGKSSTLNGIMALIPASGGITFQGHDCSRQSTEQRVRSGMTLTPEGRRVFPTLTVAENLRLGAAANRASKHALAQTLDLVFSLFPILHERRSQLGGTLSGGQQQQLAIARSLMSRPKLLLLDEPSLGLAPKIVEDIFELILRLRQQGITLLVVEQNVSMALEIADRAYVLANGAIAQQGNAAELRTSDQLQQIYLGATH